MKCAAFALVSLSILGCGTTPPIDEGAPLELGARDGILVVHVRSTIPIEKLKMDGSTLASDLPPGEHMLLRVVRSGRHRWSDIVIPAGEGDVPFRMSPTHERWKFRVEAGRTTYPGELVVGGRTRKESVDISVRILNRSASALRKLRENHPELLERYPPAWGGLERDDYLSYFGRSFLSREAGATESRRP